MNICLAGAESLFTRYEFVPTSTRTYLILSSLALQGQGYHGRKQGSSNGCGFGVKCVPTLLVLLERVQVWQLTVILSVLEEDLSSLNTVLTSPPLKTIVEDPV